MPGKVFTRRRLMSALGLGAAMTITDYPDWNAPTGHANAIAATGAPLLNLHTQQGNQQAAHIAPGATASLGTFTINQPGYLAVLGAQVFSGSPAGPVTLTLTWSDSSSTVTTGQKSYTSWPGTTGNLHQVTCYGRNRGNQVTYAVKNNSSGATISAGMTLISTSVPFTADRVISQVLSALASGNTQGMYDLGAGIIGANDINTLGAGSGRTDDLGLYQGKAWLYAQTASGTTDLTAQVQADTDQLVTGQAQTLFKGVSGTKGFLTAELELPGSQCSITVTNGNASAQRVNYQVTAEEL